MSRYQPHDRGNPNFNRRSGDHYENQRDHRVDRNYTQSNHQRYDDQQRFDSRSMHGRSGRGEPPPPGEDVRIPYQTHGRYPSLPHIPPPLLGHPMQPSHNQAHFRRSDSHLDGYSYNQRRAFEQERNHDRQEQFGVRRHGDRDRNSHIRFDNRGDPSPGGPSELAFCVDSTPDVHHNLSRAFGNRQSPSYSRLFYRDNVLGASEHYVNNVQFGCKLAVKESDTSEAETPEPKKSPAVKRKINTIEFFSMANANEDASQEEGDQIQGLSRKESRIDTHDRVEKYNIDLRNQPSNEALWKEFVQFQEQIFNEEQNPEEAEDGVEAKKKKKKGRRKAMLEKQVAILDKAVGLNPKNLELHMLRLNIMYEIYKPNHVLTEWKKLVATTHAQVSPFWMEYLVFSCSDLQIYSTTSVTQSFERAFDKFRAMLSSDLPDSQKPEKFSLFLADLVFSLSIILKAAGHVERAVSLHQAQLELCLSFPKNDPETNSTDWKAMLGKFWKLESRRFGETGAQGWCNSINGTEDLAGKHELCNTTLNDTDITEFEDLFYQSLNDSNSNQSANQQVMNRDWLFMESFRSKVYWMPWRPNVSDVDECDDSQRIVPFSDVSPFLVKLPYALEQSDFERNALNFRHIVNYLTLLREDFMPKTYTLDSILSTFTYNTLTESRTLLNEIFYWKKHLSLYHDENFETDKVPEGFQIAEIISPGFYATEGRGSLPINKMPSINAFRSYSSDIESQSTELLKENQEKYRTMIRTIVEQSIEHLDSPFAIVLVQMLLRFEQKNKYSSLENHKSLMKFARNLMKHEKLRSSPATYGEIALLEYFADNTEKAIELLVKTINSSGKLLSSNEELNIESDWELIADLSRLYRLLAEFYLKENSQLSLHILFALGNNFESVETTSTNSPKNKNQFLKAKRQFENVLKLLVPYVFDNNDISIDGEVANIANKLDGDKCIEFFLQKLSLIVEWTSAYALFQFLSEDFESASEIYTSVLGKIKAVNSLNRASKYQSEDVSISHLREQLYWSWCKLGALALSQNPMLNSKFRTILGNALQEFPSSPPFLVLFAQIESQCSVAGRLWRAMLNLVKQESTQPIVSLHWTPLFMSLNLAMKIDELEHDAEMSLEPFGLGGPAVPPDTIFYKLDAILSAAETNTITKHCPLIWRVHMKHLAIRVHEGKDKSRARSLFYDAIRHCPSNKAIYLDAITYFPDMKQEVMQIMAEKQILVRLPQDEFELLMTIDDELKNEVESKSNPNKRAAESDSDSEGKKKVVKKSKKSSPGSDDGEISN